MIAVIVPAVIAPGFSYLLLRLVIDLEATQDRLRLLAMHDDLTGAFNRRHFLEEAERELARAQRYGTPFSLVLFDLDDFKQVNDTFGHAAGDHVLRVVSDRCTESARSLDTFARYGGEEFVFVLPATDHTQALAFAERVRRVLADSGISFQDQEMHITASLGVTTFSARTRNLDDLLTAADEAVYRAKAQGKNKVVSGER